MNTHLNQRTHHTLNGAHRPVPNIAINRRFPRQLPPGILLCRARHMMGISRQQMAQYMGIPNPLLRKFEYSMIQIPNSFLLKIFMFGLDFWSDGICWGDNDYAPSSQGIDGNI